MQDASLHHDKNHIDHPKSGLITSHLWGVWIWKWEVLAKSIFLKVITNYIAKIAKIKSVRLLLFWQTVYSWSQFHPYKCNSKNLESRCRHFWLYQILWNSEKIHCFIFIQCFRLSFVSPMSFLLYFLLSVNIFLFHYPNTVALFFSTLYFSPLILKVLY